MGSGGGGGPSNQTVTQTNIPEYARPYFERMMDRSEASSSEPYQAYPGQRVEGLNTVQQNAISNISNMGPNNAVAHAAAMGGVASNGMLGNARFDSNNIASTYNPNAVQMFNAPAATRMFNAPDRVASDFQGGEFTGNDVDKYMSPYQQKVIDIAKREANRQFAQDNVARDANAAKSGSFGGSRAALVKQEAARQHAQQLDDIQSKGSQQAYENAQQQYERDRQARLAASQMGLGAQQFNSQQQMAYGNAGMQNQQFNNQQAMQYGQLGLGAQQFNEQARQQAAQMALQGQIANEQARAAAAGIRGNAWNNYGNMAGQMANIGQTQQNMDLQRYMAAMGAGDKVQQTNQSALDTAYDNFVNQRDYDRQSLQFLGSMLRGVPVTANSDVRTSQASNPLSQIAGLGIAGLGAYNASKG